MGFNFETIENLGLGIVSLVVAVIIVGFVVFFFSKINDSFQTNDGIDQSVKDLLDEQNTKQSQFWDYAFLAAFMALTISTIAVARSENVSGVWVFVFLLALIMLSIVIAWVSNMYGSFADGGLIDASQMPITTHIIGNLLIYVLVIGFLSLYVANDNSGGF